MYDKTDIISFLDARMYINFPTRDGYLPQSIACTNGFMQNCSLKEDYSFHLLLDLDTEDVFENSSLKNASRYKHLDVFKLLIKNDARLERNGD